MNRLDYGHAWMMCNECGAKLFDIDYHKDIGRDCPYIKGDYGECTDNLKY